MVFDKLGKEKNQAGEFKQAGIFFKVTRLIFLEVIRGRKFKKKKKKTKKITAGCTREKLETVAYF